MADTVTVQMTGLRELQQELQARAADMQKNVSRAAVRAGLAVIRDASRAAAPVDTGALRKSIISWRSRRDSRNGLETGKVGIKSATVKFKDTAKNRARNRVGKGYKTQPPTYYWRFLEFGTSKMAPRPFFGPAFNANKERAAAAIVDKIRLSLLTKPRA